MVVEECFDKYTLDKLVTEFPDIYSQNVMGGRQKMDEEHLNFDTWAAGSPTWKEFYRFMRGNDVFSTFMNYYKEYIEYWQGNVGEPLTYSSANSICSSLSFKELNEIINAEVYPNPCDGVLNIKLGKYSKDVNYKIIDNQGKVVMLGVLNSVNSFVDISNISSGIYMINIENNSPIKIIRK